MATTGKKILVQASCPALFFLLHHSHTLLQILDPCTVRSLCEHQSLTCEKNIMLTKHLIILKFLDVERNSLTSTTVRGFGNTGNLVAQMHIV